MGFYKRPGNKIQNGGGERVTSTQELCSSSTPSPSPSQRKGKEQQEEGVGDQARASVTQAPGQAWGWLGEGRDLSLHRQQLVLRPGVQGPRLQAVHPGRQEAPTNKRTATCSRGSRAARSTPRTGSRTCAGEYRNQRNTVGLISKVILTILF